MENDLLEVVPSKLQFASTSYATEKHVAYSVEPRSW